VTEDSRFFEQFIDDYFAETEEHLTSVRRVLLELDGRAGEVAAASLLQDLARSLHTLKGLSGMVGLASAEHVAHAMEDRARALTNLHNVDGAVVQDLFEGAALLERCVQARRTNSEPPSIDSYVARVRAGRGEDTPQAPTTVRSGVVIVGDACFVFTPSAETASRGIGVETIRERLSGLGEIVHAAPRVQHGRVTFEFTVALSGERTPPDEWRADGLEWDSGTFALTSTAGALVPAAFAPSMSPPGTQVASTAVRVDLARLDDIMRMVGDLVVLRARMDEMLDAGDTTAARWDSLRDANALMERQIRALREGVTRIRLVPIGEVFERMRFALREVARDAGKSVTLELQGQDTEIDKLVVDRMLEPLLHLVRNAVGHGIESPDARRALGKRAEGRLSLRARAEGDRIVLEVEDDGSGIDPERVAERARHVGLLAPSQELAESDLLDVLCEPGFSTRASADMTSGRGVGMAVVRAAVRGLGGELSLHTTPGEGTRYVIELPLTLMIADALLFDVGDQSFAIPQLVLREIVQLEPGTVKRLENNEVLPYRDGVLPLIRLRRTFNVATADRDGRFVLVVGNDAQLTGLVVDRIVGLREIVVHPVNDPLIALPGIAGATELTNGRVSLIVDAAAIVRRGREDRHRPGLLPRHSPPHHSMRELSR
jgi:two-component system chemotaxis sensor kinase CheA